MHTEHPPPDSLTVYVDPYPGRPGNERVYFDCSRCDGTGSVSWGANVDGALYDPATGKERIVPQVCFQCNGVGRNSHLVASARESARRRVAAARKALARAARREAEEAARAAEVEEARARYSAEHPEAVEALQALRPGAFAESVRASFAARGYLTAAQAEVVVRMAAEQASEPEPSPVIEGRIVITGMVLSVKWDPSQYGDQVCRMTVLDDRGFKVWGTRPAALGSTSLRDEAGGYQHVPAVSAGDRVTFTARVRASGDDPTFGFYSRPVKAARA